MMERGRGRRKSKSKSSSRPLLLNDITPQDEVRRREGGRVEGWRWTGRCTDG